MNFSNKSFIGIIRQNLLYPLNAAIFSGFGYLQIEPTRIAVNYAPPEEINKAEVIEPVIEQKYQNLTKNLNMEEQQPLTRIIKKINNLM